jgi:hypothetical protein
VNQQISNAKRKGNKAKKLNEMKLIEWKQNLTEIKRSE